MKLAAAFNQGGKFPTIGVVNQATVPLGCDLDALIKALQKFLDEYFVPIWGYPATLQAYPTIEDIPKDQWVFLFIDDADAANALGYHDLTINGQPVSKIFVMTTIADGQLVSVTACHELAEMLIDPGAQIWAQRPDGTFVAYEMSDPVEEQTFEIDGIVMSNFVFPSYFEGWHQPHSVQFDYLSRLTEPYQIDQGGYLIINQKGDTTQIFGSEAKAERFAKEDRRLHRSEYRQWMHKHNVRKQLNRIERKIDKMAIDQKTFDTDLVGLVTAIGQLIDAVNTKINNTPAADFTAEDTQVQQAAAQVQSALAGLNPPSPPPPVAPAP